MNTLNWLRTLDSPLPPKKDGHSTKEAKTWGVLSGMLLVLNPRVCPSRPDFAMTPIPAFILFNKSSERLPCVYGERMRRDGI